MPKTGINLYKEFDHKNIKFIIDDDTEIFIKSPCGLILKEETIEHDQIEGSTFTSSFLLGKHSFQLERRSTIVELESYSDEELENQEQLLDDGFILRKMRAKEINLIEQGMRELGRKPIIHGEHGNPMALKIEVEGRVVYCAGDLDDVLDKMSFIESIINEEKAIIAEEYRKAKNRLIREEKERYSEGLISPDQFKPKTPEFKPKYLKAWMDRSSQVQECIEKWKEAKKSIVEKRCKTCNAPMMIQNCFDQCTFCFTMTPKPPTGRVEMRATCSPGYTINTEKSRLENIYGRPPFALPGFFDLLQRERDMKFLDQRHFKALDLARMFQLPVHVAHNLFDHPIGFDEEDDGSVYDEPVTVKWFPTVIDSPILFTQDAIDHHHKMVEAAVSEELSRRVEERIIEHMTLSGGVSSGKLKGCISLVEASRKCGKTLSFQKFVNNLALDNWNRELDRVKCNPSPIKTKINIGETITIRDQRPTLEQAAKRLSEAVKACAVDIKESFDMMRRSMKSLKKEFPSGGVVHDRMPGRAINGPEVIAPLSVLENMLNDFEDVSPATRVLIHTSQACILIGNDQLHEIDGCDERTKLIYQDNKSKGGKYIILKKFDDDWNLQLTVASYNKDRFRLYIKGKLIYDNKKSTTVSRPYES